MRLITFWKLTAKAWLLGDTLEDAKWYAQQVVYGWREE
jgi:hypothetical protein